MADLLQLYKTTPDIKRIHTSRSEWDTVRVRRKQVVKFNKESQVKFNEATRDG